MLVNDTDAPPTPVRPCSVIGGAAGSDRRGQSRSCGGASRMERRSDVSASSPASASAGDTASPSASSASTASAAASPTASAAASPSAAPLRAEVVMDVIQNSDDGDSPPRCCDDDRDVRSDDQGSPPIVRHREDSGYAAGCDRPRDANGDTGRSDHGLTDLERSAASGTDSGKQSADEEDDVFDGCCCQDDGRDGAGDGAGDGGGDGRDGAGDGDGDGNGDDEPTFCSCEHSDCDTDADADAGPELDLGTSVESCYSACDFYAANVADAEWSAAMMDSMYSTGSDRTLPGDCSCLPAEDCTCGGDVDPPRSCSGSGSGSGSGSDTASCDTAGSDADSESESDSEDPRAVSISGLSERMVRLMASVSEGLSERRRLEETAGSFHASSPHRQQSLFRSLDGAQPCRVGTKELTKTFDTKDMLSVAFEQARQTRRMCSGGGEGDEEDFRRFARFSECDSEVSASGSEAGAGRLSARERTSSSELNSSVDTMSDDYLLEAIGRDGGGWPDRFSFSSAQSDSSVEVLDLETTGDFPRHFRFAGAPPLDFPEPAENGRLADKLRHVSGDSAVSQATVVESRERELDAVEEIEVLLEEDPPPAPLELGKRNLLHRFLDMTADLLAGAPRDGDDADVRPRATLARSNSTTDRRRSVTEQGPRPRAATVNCRRCLKTRDRTAARSRRGSWQPGATQRDGNGDGDGEHTT